MSKVDDITRLKHMLDAATKACEFTQGKSRSSLDSDEILSLAIVRLIEIIGEAAAKLSADKRNELPQIPWRDVISMRNRIVHAYFDINLDLVWQTIVEDLPDLIAELDAILSDPSV
jgi:uncharacterized protein with HEPN domain